MQYDYCVIGGGIVGLSTALHLLEKRPGTSLVLIEKEHQVGQHQTGHNSGVIHSGIYYAPGSLKAELCRQGCEATKAFCREHGIDFDVCGKLLVATNDIETERLRALYQRASDNGVDVSWLGETELQEREPNITGTAALLVPATGIVDYGAISRKMAELIIRKGGEIILGEAVTAIEETGNGVALSTPSRTLSAGQLIACAGVHSDRLARLAGLEPEVRIVPFKGEYFQLPPDKNQIVRHLIYPVPDPALPFLGIHLTRMIDGSVTVGPNAVLSLAREGYGKFDFKLADMIETFGYAGFWRVVLNNFGSSLTELANSLNRRGYLRACQKYCPGLTLEDLKPYPPGIRAQAVGKDGTLIHDFLFARTERMIHVLNAPSPAATAALPIGARIADQVHQ